MTATQDTEAGPAKINADILQSLRIHQTSRPDVAMLEITGAAATSRFLVSRKAMRDIADHLAKNADDPAASEQPAAAPSP